MENTYARIKAMLVDHSTVGEEHVTFDARLWEDLQLDDLDLIALKKELESAYGREINSEDLHHLTTVGDLVAFVEGRLPNDQN